MSGIFGSSAIDRHCEKELNDYLNDLDKIECGRCGWHGRTDDDYEDGKKIYCPQCSFEI